MTLEEILGAIEHARVRLTRAGRPVRPGAAVAARRSRPSRRTGSTTPPAAGPAREVLVAEAVAAEGIELLRADHEVDVRTVSRATSCARSCPSTTRSIVRSQVQVDAELIAAGTRLVVIGRAGVGVDNVDLDAATRAGITVVNAPTGNTIAAAEHTLALLYGVARRTAPPTRRSVGASGSAPSSRASSCAAGRSASSGSARSARPSRSAPGPWR